MPRGWQLFLDDRPDDNPQKPAPPDPGPGPKACPAPADGAPAAGQRASWIARHQTLTGLLVIAAVLIVAGIVNAETPPTPGADDSATTSTQPPPSPLPVPPAAPTPAATPLTDPGSLQGLFNNATYWDQHYQSAAAARCESEGETPGLGTLRAWTFADGALACIDDTAGAGPWAGRIVGVDVYFPPHTDEKTAIADIATLLPTDATENGRYDGVNPDYSSAQTGSCRSINHTSAALARDVAVVNPSWAYPSEVEATLYSGTASSSDGAETAYRPGSIHEAIVTLGTVSRGADSNVHC